MYLKNFVAFTPRRAPLGGPLLRKTSKVLNFEQKPRFCRNFGRRVSDARQNLFWSTNMIYFTKKNSMVLRYLEGFASKIPGGVISPGKYLPPPGHLGWGFRRHPFGTPTDFGAIFEKNFGHQDCVFTEGKVTRIGPKTSKNFATRKYQELASDPEAKHPEGHQGSIEPIKNAY